MREALFIKKNRDRWLKNQHMPSSDADEMAADFTQLVDDLAYAKTFYPTSKVTDYINKQASTVYLDIYRNRKEETNRIWRFWKTDLPLTIHKHHRTVLFSFILFLIFGCIGFFVSKHDPDMAASVLGPDYVTKTQENIDAGNPFGIYESGNPVLSWLHLMIHNIRVSFVMFVAGIFAGIPSIYLLSENAIMVGVFDQFFAAKGFGVQFFMVVFIHGMLELTALIVAAAAGMVLGKSYLFPGTVRRIDAFKQGAKDGVKIMVGLMPVFGLAAFFEGFITRLYNDLSILTSAITVLSAVFVVWYFIIYPIRLGKKMAAVLNEEEV
ncbi:MAG: stage II sporulation protein M [Chitinophagaceae bacterium]|nr:MAG: stage II sporulation protein M [Chitinophagaceae bacterium]